jgi:hypothetical protein
MNNLQNSAAVEALKVFSQEPTEMKIKVLDAQHFEAELLEIEMPAAK